MRLIITISIGLCVLFGRPAYAELAVIPYRIDNSSAEFPESTGGEYSRLLSVASIIAKDNIEVTPPREIDLDLERMKLSPQEVITQDDLDLLGRTRRIDYFLLGGLARKGGGYRSESVLYSVRDQSIIVRTRVEDVDLFGLAAKEMREALISFRNKNTGRESRGSVSMMDVLFLLDLSYRMNADWASVKNAIAGFSADLIDTRRVDTRVYIVPFSDRATYPSGSVSINSITAVRSELDKLKPSGGAGPENFIKSLRYAVSSVRWRAGAKAMIVISNSSLTASNAEQYASMARKKGISIHAISLGLIPGDDSELLDRLAAAGGGSHDHAAYHQKLFDAGGERVDVYMENGRLFASRFPDREWRNGLYEANGSGRAYGKPKSFVDELFFNEKNMPATPYAMPQLYARITMKRIINQEEPENNIGELMNRLLRRRTKPAMEEHDAAGRALVSDGSVSFWVRAPNEDYMNYFVSRQKSGSVAHLGVTVKRDAAAVYGIALVPLVKDLSADYIPRCLKVSLGDIVKRSEYYMTKGLLYPPVWFVSVKVDSAERSRRKQDIRNK